MALPKQSNVSITLFEKFNTDRLKQYHKHNDKVIKFCKNKNILLAVEAIMIKKLKPKLNHQLGTDKGSRITLNIFK